MVDKSLSRSLTHLFRLGNHDISLQFQPSKLNFCCGKTLCTLSGAPRQSQTSW